jgi:hypothetical protein
MSMSSGIAVAPSPETFRVGNVLSRAIGLLSRKGVLFVLVSAVTQLPNLVVALHATGVRSSAPGAAGAELGLVVLFGVLVLIPLVQTVVYHAAFQDMLGRPIRLGDSLGIAFRRFFPVLGALICMGAAIGLGFALLIVPGVIWAAMFAVAVPACVVERLGPIASCGRSAYLTKGNRWKVIGIGLSLIVVSFAVGAIAFVLPFVLGVALGALVNLVLNAVLGAFYSLVAVVMYHDLRVAKEGIGTDRIAAVFD